MASWSLSQTSENLPTLQSGSLGRNLETSSEAVAQIGADFSRLWQKSRIHEERRRSLLRAAAVAVGRMRFDQEGGVVQWSLARPVHETISCDCEGSRLQTIMVCGR